MLCCAPSKSSFLFIDARTLTSISVVRSLVSVDDVVFTFVRFRHLLLRCGFIHIMHRELVVMIIRHLDERFKGIEKCHEKVCLP